MVSRLTETTSTNVLFLSANPKETEPLELINECNKISDKIKSAKFGRQFNFDQRHEVSAARLDDYLLDYKPQIVHFSGHGSDDGIMTFQNEDGQAEGSEIRDVADLFRILNERDSVPKIRCVVLNACYSERQAKAISKYVDCVVGMKNAIRDDAARIFAESFYYPLCSGESVYTAFELGRNKVARLNIPGQDIPKLLSHKDIDPKKITFIVSNRNRGKTYLEGTIGPNVKIKQKIKKAKKKVTGIDARGKSKGTYNANQQIGEANGDVTGVKI